MDNVSHKRTNANHTCMMCGGGISQEFYEMASSASLTMCEECMEEMFTFPNILII